MPDSHNFAAEQLHAITRSLYLAAGAPHHIADAVAAILVNSNLCGHDSHGVLHLPRYLKEIEDGTMDPAAEPTALRETSTFLQLDGGEGPGHYTARVAMQRAIEKAKQAEICRVSFVRIRHIGRLGEYAEMAAAAGCVGIVVYSGGGNRILPHGGRVGALGTNPIAAAFPTGDDAPFSMDFATSSIAVSKMLVAQSKGEQLPEGCIVDRDGRPSVDPQDFFDGGYLCSFGAHKGYALGLFVNLLAGLSGEFDATEGTMGGTVMLAIDIGSMTPLAEYEKGARAFLDRVKATPPAPGFDEVIAPGDFEARSRTLRRRDGIDLPSAIADEIQSWAQKLGVQIGDDIAEEADRQRYRHE